ncbi:MAG: helix-turn-helix domain-containing protein [Tissierellia bacterium]|nr:helix-turn-helix domain-containing protein [Tissierellia bacterium]
MRKEYVHYSSHLPLQVKYMEFNSVPLRWKNALTILWVLKGGLVVTVETEKFFVLENQVEIINANEVFAIEGRGENRVLMLEIDPAFFQRYYEEAEETFFYTNAPGDRKDDWRYLRLKELLARLSYEAVRKMDDFDEQVESLLLKLMYHLLNHFHYLYYEEQSLKEDDEQLARYHRIVKYLSNNYMDRVRLSDLADEEYLSESYLSSQIKEMFGQGFKEYLNQIRVEESTKLLLDSDFHISRISEEVGFSHVRYFNQHFKRHYHMTPREYRKRFRLSDEDVDKMTIIAEKPWEEAVEAMTPQLRGWSRFFVKDRMRRVDLSWREESIGEFPKPTLIDMGDASLWLEEENRELFKTMQHTMNWKYGLIRDLFSDDMDIYRGKNRRFINWTRVEGILEFFHEMKLEPVIETKGIEKYIINDFIDSFSYDYGEEVVKEWLETRDPQWYPKPLPVERHSYYDRLEAVTWILDGIESGEGMYRWEAVDMITRSVELTNETFFGGPGLCTANFLKKPAYFVMAFLSMMGDELVAEGDGYWLTRSDDEYQLLCYNGNGPKWEDGDFTEGSRDEQKWAVNLKGLSVDYIITRFALDANHGSLYDRWESIGEPERLNAETWERFSTYIHPRMDVVRAEKAPIFNLVFNTKANGVMLFLFKPQE